MARLVLAILAVDDAPRAAAFYVAGFGWERRVDLPHYVELADAGGMRLGLYRRDGYARNTGVAPAPIDAAAVGPAEVYLHVDDVDGAVARLVDAGARLLSAAAPRAWGDHAAYLADPDGHVVVVARPG